MARAANERLGGVPISIKLAENGALGELVRPIYVMSHPAAPVMRVLQQRAQINAISSVPVVTPEALEHAVASRRFHPERQDGNGDGERLRHVTDR